MVRLGSAGRAHANNNSLRWIFARLAAAALIAHLPLPASGSNGFNLIGFGAESIGLGGADTAVSRDTTALNTNPAGLSQTAYRAADLYLTAGYALDISHADMFGNDKKISNRVGGYTGGGYAQRINGSPLTLGIGLFAQGGVGLTYKDLATAFGTRDELSSRFRILKLTPGAAYRVTDKLSVGASVSYVYADIKQNIFPDTSFFNTADPQASFFGFRMKNASGSGVGVKAGVMYDASERVTLAASYTSKSRLSLQGGELVANLSALGLGNVSYRDAAIDGLALPREVAIGLALKPAEAWLIALKVNWIDWSNALRASTLLASGPEDPRAPASLRIDTPLNWSNQTVYAAGIAYQLSQATILRAGFNYGKNPIPANTTNPLLNVIGQRHLTAGFGHSFAEQWRVDSAVEYQFGERVRYTNPSLPFGANAEERNRGIALHVMLGRRW